MKDVKLCNCHQPLTFKQSLAVLVDEVKEFIEEPSKDEASDVAYCINRMVGGLFGKSIITGIPCGGMHIAKVQQRMHEYGCIRSKRHLVDGKCPTQFLGNP